MEKKITEFILILLGIGLAMFAAVKLLSGGFVDIIWVMVCMVPFILALFLGLRNWWPLMAVLMPLMPMPTAGAVLLDKITPTLVLHMAIIGFFAGHICMRHNGVSLATKYARPMLVVAVMITARLIMDPPGSGRVGGTGGLAMAMNYFIAGWCFFSIWWATLSSAVSERMVAKWFLLITAGLFGRQLIMSFSTEVFYHRQSWVFWSFLLGWVAYRSGSLKGRWGLFYLLSCVVMACGVINPHRKSLVMAGLTCLATAWVFRVEKKQIQVLGLVGALGLSLLLSTGHVPDVMKRSLSTIIPSLTISDHNAGYMGWEDDFRSRNLELAMTDILRHPLIGRGFAFSTQEVVAMLNRQDRSGMAGASDIANAVGTQHYGFISLMTCIGAIVPWFFAAAGIGIFIRFIQFARGMPGGYPKALASGLACYFINQVFQWLFNGSGDRMLDVSVALAIMMGLLQKWRSSEKTEMLDVGRPVAGGMMDC